MTPQESSYSRWELSNRDTVPLSTTSEIRQDQSNCIDRGNVSDIDQTCVNMCGLEQQIGVKSAQLSTDLLKENEDMLDPGHSWLACNSQREYGAGQSSSY